MKIEAICHGESITATADTTLKEISRLMKEKQVGCILIVDKKTEEAKPIGILTDRDIALQLSATDETLQSMKAETIMQKDLLILRKDQGLKEGIIEMRKKGVRRAPVVDEKNKLCGFLAVDDLMCCLTEALAEVGHLIHHQTSKTHCSEK